MKKILMITPHLSTGGQPQYLLKQIENTSDVVFYCVEWSDVTGGVYTVQRNKIKDLLGDRLYTLYEDKNDIYRIIEEIQPDVIHFQEIPETFVDYQILNNIYSNDRSYFIVVTTHSSYTEPSELKWLADRFILVSEWSRRKFEDYFQGSIPCDVWEYPIEKHIYDKNSAKNKLGFELDYKHVLHVGLFTSGKNQGIIFELAKMCELKGYKIKFHFVGNQAINFENYWKPLMESKPDNCIVHGEQSNVSDYYMASDLFYFPSLWELNPLSVKEALSYNLPVFIKNLPTYEGMYNHCTYILDEQNENLENLINMLNPDKEIPGWFSYEELYSKFVSEAKDGNKIVEIGSWFGKSTNFLKNEIEKSNKDIILDVIDTFKGTLNEELHQDLVKDYDNDIYQQFYNNVKPFGKINIVKDTSHNASLLYKNGEIDFIMIDGDHSYEGVTSDINDFFYKVKPGGIISGDDYNVFNGTTQAVNEFFRNSHNITSNNVNWWYRIPRIQVIHISTTPRQERVKTSLSNINVLKKYNIDIKTISNPVYNGEIDLSKYRLQDNIHNVKPSHYGCYLGHIQALKEIDETNYDYTIIMEEDAYIYTNTKEFVDMVHKTIFTCENDSDIHYVSFGASNCYEELEYDNLFKKCWHQDLAHCYLIPNKKKSWYMSKIDENPWDVADLWYNHIFCHDRKTRLATNNIYSKQLDGISLIDRVYKKW